MNRIHETGTDNPIDFPVEEKNQSQEQQITESVAVYVDPLTRLKNERLLKKEKKKAVKQMTQKFGDTKLAKRMVKTAVKRIMTRKAGRGR